MLSSRILLDTLFAHALAWACCVRQLEVSGNCIGSGGCLLLPPGCVPDEWLMNEWRMNGGRPGESYGTESHMHLFGAKLIDQANQVHRVLAMHIYTYVRSNIISLMPLAEYRLGRMCNGSYSMYACASLALLLS